MKRIVLVLSLIASTAWGQNADNKLAIGLMGGLSDYYGDVNGFTSQKWFNTDGPFQGHGGLGFNYYLSPWFNLGLEGTYGSLGYTAENFSGLRTQMIQSNLNLKIKANNGLLMKEDAKLQPYILFGLGFARYFPNHPTPASFRYLGGNDGTLNAGLGANYMITPQLALNYNLNWAYTGRDKRDGVSNLTDASGLGTNDQFMIHTVGIVFGLGKTKDTDMDGVSDRRDICPSTPSGVKVNVLTGCPLDGDNDGIADYEDKCPEVAGSKAFMGCPDTDNDGIQDSEDMCKDVKGVASAKGCPDSDMDGIKDADDKCPTIKGTVAMMGCPDADGDGITDAEDKCPSVKGLASMKGCPDADNDGIIDSEDKCPTVSGVASNNGCPEIKEETKKVFEQALKGIQFEPGKDIIKKTSYGILDNVAKIMADNPTYKLEINGHTDNQGDDAKNLELSKKRAEAVKKYLVSKGCAENRLTPAGFGETMPKATNDTPAGKAENRRVEFVVKF